MKVPDGYQILEKGKITRRGDIYWSDNRREWRTTFYPGTEQGGCTYYRKLSPVSGRVKRDPRGSLQRRVGSARSRRTNPTLLTRAVGSATAVPAPQVISTIYKKYKHLDDVFRMASGHGDDDPWHRALKDMWIAICSAVIEAPGAPPRAERARRANADIRHGG